LHNDTWDTLYRAHIEIVKRENNDVANEMDLFHGTKSQGCQGIIKSNFDDRHIEDGAWGFGMYFAQDPMKSDKYTEKNGVKGMFLCSVILGKTQVLEEPRRGRISPDVGYHSVTGFGFSFPEYIVYRYGQAKPLYYITYSEKWFFSISILKLESNSLN